MHKREYFRSLDLTSQTKPGPNIELAVTMNSRCSVSIEPNESSRSFCSSGAMGFGSGERVEKKNALLCAIDA